MIFFIFVLLHFFITARDIKGGFCLYILMYPLFPKFLSPGFSDDNVAMTLQRVMLMVIALKFLLEFFLNFGSVVSALRAAFRSSLMCFYLIGFLFFYLISNLLSAKVAISDFARLVEILLSSLFVVVMCVYTVRTKKDVMIVAVLIALGMIVNEFVAIFEFVKGGSLFAGFSGVDYQVASGRDVWEGRVRGDQYRSMGFFSSALELMFFISIASPLMFWSAKYGKGVLKAVAVTALFLMPLGIYFSGSRTGLMLVVGIFSVMIWQVWVKKSSLMVSGSYVTAILCSISVGAIVFGDVFVDLFIYGTGDEKFYLSTMARLQQYVEAYFIWIKAPLFGSGVNRDILDLGFETLDNYLLRILVETGSVGFSFYILFLISLIAFSFRQYLRSSGGYNKNLSFALMLMVGMVVALMLVVGNPFVYVYLYLIMGLLCSHRLIMKQEGFVR